MNKALIIVSLGFLCFSFSGKIFADTTNLELEGKVKNLKKEIRKQEEMINVLKHRYDRILRQKQELQESINQEKHRVEQAEKFDEAKKLKIEAEKKDLRNQATPERQQEIKQEESRQLEIEKQKRAQLESLLQQKDTELKAKEEEYQNKLAGMQSRIENEAAKQAELEDKEAARAELEKRKQKEACDREELKREGSKTISLDQPQSHLESERDEQMSGALEAEEKSFYVKCGLELDSLAKQRKSLFEESEKIEKEILKEENNIRGLEIKKNSLIEQRKELQKREK